MTNKAKRIISIVIVSIIVISLAVLIISCSAVKEYEYKYLEDAYEAGWLTEDDLRIIANYYNNGTLSEIPLSKEKENNIRHTYLQEADIYKYRPDATVNDVSVFNYYGIYNGYAVAFLRDRFFQYDYKFWQEKEIGGVMFYNYIGLWVYDTNS